MAIQWDLSYLDSPLASAARAIPFGDQDSNPVEDESQASQAGESALEKFPQPATIPAGWDLSELLGGV